MSLIIPNPYHWPITLENATPTADGVMSAADKLKLDGLSAFLPVLQATVRTVDVVPAVLLSVDLPDLMLTGIFPSPVVGVPMTARVRGGLSDGYSASYNLATAALFKVGIGFPTSVRNPAPPVTSGPAAGSDAVFAGSTVASSFSAGPAIYTLTVTGVAGETIDWTLYYQMFSHA